MGTVESSFLAHVHAVVVKQQAKMMSDTVVEGRDCRGNEGCWTRLNFVGQSTEFSPFKLYIV